MVTVRLVLIGCFRDRHFQIPPMDPEKLENFRAVKEITGGSLQAVFSLEVNAGSGSVSSSCRVPDDRRLGPERHVSVSV